MDPRRVIALDAGGTKLLAGVVDDRGVVHHCRRRLLRGVSRAELLDIFVEAVEEARAVAPDAEAVGFGIPALVDAATGFSVSSVHLPLDDLPFADVMGERLGLPVAVDNDTTAAIVAEHRLGAAAGAATALMLTLGTGIGGGLILGGEVFRGHSGAAGEFGHIVVDLDGPPCQGGCPNRGCLEVMASGTAIGRLGEEAGLALPGSALGRATADLGGMSGEVVTELALAGDEAARGILAEVGRRLGAGLSSLVNIFNPDVIVIGGGALNAGELILASARAEVAWRALRPSRDEVRIVAARFGQEAGMVGAGQLALDLRPARLG
jgi:glucokinase